MSKRMAAHAGAVIKGIFFIGFSIQIILGVIWMCCNFARIQDFPAPDTTLYSALFRLLGERASLMYLLQLAAAFAVGYYFLQCLIPVGRIFALWRALVLLTFPFALQCHMALQPHSFVGTLFLLMLLFAVKAVRGNAGAAVENKNSEQTRGGETAEVVKKGKNNKSLRFFGVLGLSLLCACGVVLMSGIIDEDNREVFARRGIDGNIASRFAWHTLINDADYWSDDLWEIVDEVWWASRYCPGNMELLFEAIEEQAPPGEVREYIRQIAQVGWENRKPMIIRQMGWDVLGYTVTPLLVPMQLEGESYDTCTGRNYEAMRGAAPVFTKYYVNYGCWWFGVELGLSLLLSVIQFLGFVTGKEQSKKGIFRIILLPVGICAFASGVLVTILTFRGAGLMDYKWTIAVNELWLIWSLLLMGRVRTLKDEVVK